MASMKRSMRDPDPSAQRFQPREIHPRWIYLTASLLLTALPFVAVDYAPGTDLPQHAAQARLLRELWGLAPATVDLSAFVARPWGANTLCYWPLLLFSTIAPPEVAIRLTVFVWLAGALAGLHTLALRRGRPLSHALAAGILLFGLPLYWGLLNFVSGLGLFLLFVERVLRARSRTAAALAFDAILLLFLYLAHAMWLAAAAGLTAAVAIYRIARRRELREALGWAVVFVPVLLLVTPWMVDLVQHRAASGVRIEAEYLTPFTERLSPGWLAASLFGGVRGPFEPLMAAALATYAIVCLMRARRQAAPAMDRGLIAIGASGFAFVLLAPDQYLNTIVFNDRFFGCSAMLLLLGLPSPTGRAPAIIAGVIAALFCLGTTATWVIYDQAELSGLRPALAAIDRPRRVLQLDYRKQSDVLRDRPFMQLFAYAQAAHGGELSFSFAEHRSSVVAYREQPRRPWAPGLEWSPELAMPRDVAAFDCVLVNGTDAQHRAFAERFQRASANRAGYFRTYCRDHGAK